MIKIVSALVFFFGLSNAFANCSEVALETALASQSQGRFEFYKPNGNFEIWPSKSGTSLYVRNTGSCGEPVWSPHQITVEIGFDNFATCSGPHTVEISCLYLP